MAGQDTSLSSDGSAADLLRRALELGGEDAISVRDALGEARSRAHALALAIFSLPEALPMPVAGVSALLALPLILISGHLLIAGARAPLPDFLLRKKLDPRLLRAVAGKAERVLRRIEAVSRPRLTAIAGRERLLGAACLLLAVIVALPIPFWNMPPAICLLLIALGMLQRDGLLVLAGLLGLLAMLVAGVVLADTLVAALAR